MSKKILIMGLPGAGKSYLANILAPMLSAIWLNADKIRKQANDWDFSEEGRARQAKRMKDLSNEYLNQGKKVIADFVCPTEKLRKEYNPDFTIFMDTIKKVDMKILIKYLNNLKNITFISLKKCRTLCFANC
jgi:adenylylsulfate kinase